MNTIFVDGEYLSFAGKKYRCAIGANGLSNSTFEGSKTTPIGEYALRAGFYRADKIALRPSPLRGEGGRSPDGGEVLTKLSRDLRKNATSAEKKLWQELRLETHEHKFRRQHPIGHYIVDFICLKQKLIIELDGSYHDYVHEYDVKRTKFLKSEGYRILRFTNDDVQKNGDAVIASITAALNASHPHPPFGHLPPSRGKGANTLLYPLIPLSLDDGWCDEPKHPLYNQHVKLPFAASHEELWRADDTYDVIVPIGYNDDPIVPGKGSAIFFHIARPDYSPTLGCVAISLPDILELLPLITLSTRIRIG